MPDYRSIARATFNAPFFCPRYDFGPVENENCRLRKAEVRKVREVGDIQIMLGKSPRVRRSESYLNVTSFGTVDRPPDKRGPLFRRRIIWIFNKRKAAPDNV